MAHKKKSKYASKTKPSVTSELKNKDIPNPTKDTKRKMKKATNHAQKKRAKIIVRNLPFANLSEQLVREFFEPYGSIKEVSLLKKDNGKYVGCGFVEFEKRQSAAKAIVHGNKKEMSGRRIVVDWALPKNTFVEKVQQLTDDVKIKKEDSEDEDKKEIFEFEIDKTPEGSFKKEEKGSNAFENDDGSDAEMDPDDSDLDEMDGEDEDDEEEEEEESGKKRFESHDVEEGKTVFLKNVPFSAVNDDVKNAVEAYGPVVYALVCIDKLTEYSKGSAFVKFKDKESATNCLRDSNKILIKNQPVEVTLAVSRDKLEEEKKKKKLKSKDNRNLYLVREGVVMAGSPAAASVSASDMTKRLQIEQWKTQILRNLNMFVSRTRLVVHNVPPSYNDEKLRQLFKSHSSPSAVIKEARVMRDHKKTDSEGQPLSKELGFVTFTAHEDALHALRKINNNPDVFTPNKRPIITFSIENRQILNLKQKRLEKSRLKIMGDAKAAKGSDKMNRKQRRFLKRKAEIIRKRQEAKKMKRLEVDQSRDDKYKEKDGNKLLNNSKISISSKNAGRTSSTKSETKNVKKSSGKTQKNNSNVSHFSEKTASSTKSDTNNVGKSPGRSQKKNSNLSKSSEKTGLPKNVVQSNSDRTQKRKGGSVNEVPQKKIKNNLQDDYSGVTAEPGKKLKMRSKLKLRKQAEIHKNIKKERRKQKKALNLQQERKKNARNREPTIKGKKKNPLENDKKFTNLIAKYKSNIENAASFKKWYDS